MYVRCENAILKSRNTEVEESFDPLSIALRYMV